MIRTAIDFLRHASPAFWRGVCVCGVIFISAFSVLDANATYKPEYGKSPESVQEWFKSARVTPQASMRLNFSHCCEQAERLRTKFVGKRGGDWSYYPDPNCTAAGCALLPIPNDVIHEDRITAANPKDDGLPEFDSMRREGVLFIYSGRPTCFWPPESGI